MTIKRIDRELCDSCGICLDSCPDDVIRFDGEDKAVIVYPADCQTCFLCEEDCPRAAIEVAPEILPVPRPY
ncbi:MAG: 4Fe-4S dicluster domain-containing protein [Dehalococcoidia bacterium]|nr:4Fe-4S dicluster domain-containing protein [Dehalococcoidia bacterium]MDZ4246725.1 4Fe-4S dicluster domain-containing protein [Dehalococcoidia bacterium]